VPFSARMTRAQTKVALGCLFIPVGMIAAIIGMGTDAPHNNLLFAAGLILVAAGLMEIEIAAIWSHLGE